MRAHGLGCATKHFRPRRGKGQREGGRCARGRWTWRQERDNGAGERRRYFTKPDYALMRPEDRRKVRRARIIRRPKSNSDHLALVLRLELEPEGAAAHVKRRKCFPLTLPRAGRSDGEKLFEQLAGRTDKPDHRERPEKAWIRPETWALVDERAKLRHLQRLTRAEGRRLGRRIHAARKTNRVERARQVTQLGPLVMSAHVPGSIHAFSGRSLWSGLSSLLASCSKSFSPSDRPARGSVSG